MQRFFLIIVFISLIHVYSAQSFHRSAVVFDLNTGMEFYNTSLEYKINRVGSEGDTSIASTAGNVNLTLGFEVGFGKRLGIGLRGKANGFFKDVDNVTSKRTDITSTDLLLMLNLHPIVRKRIDFVLGVDVGVSGANFKLDDTDHTVISGKGIVGSVYLNPRVYIKKFGLNLKIYAPFVNYGNLKSSQEEANKFLIQKWKGSGIGVTLGIQVKI